MEAFFNKYLNAVEETETILYTGYVTAVKGLMIESYLVDGNQAPGGGCYGQSITDPCLGWEKTEQLCLELAELVEM